MTTRLTIRPEPPFRLDLTVWALRRRPRNTFDAWDGTRYSRVFLVDGTPVRVVIAQISPANDPELEIFWNYRGHAVANDRIVTLVTHLLGLNVNLTAFYKLAATDTHLKLLANRFVGFRPPRFPTVFEAAVNAICCQQLSLEVGIELMNRLAVSAHHGLADEVSKSRAIYAFPQPRDIAGLSEGELRELGFSRQKTAALRALASILVKDESFLERLLEMDSASAQTQLLEIKGIGRWSAEYILLRGLGQLSIFPADDIAAQKNLWRWFGIGVRTDQSAYDRIQQALRKWRPYGGLVYFHLLLASLAERNFLSLPPNIEPPQAKTGRQG